MAKPLVLDLHIPYCIRPENYLAHFNAVGSNAEKNAYMDALKREVLSYEGELDGYEIRAVHLSGGSASVMAPDLLGDVLRTVRTHLPVAQGAEVSYDSLPVTIGTPSLTGIASGHPNRTELMMRSDNDAELKALGCTHNAQHIRNAMLFLAKFHLNNVGLTLNYGIPGQTMQSWHNSLHAAVIMQAGHITAEPLAVTDAESMPNAAERFTEQPLEEVLSMAHQVWESINLVNLQHYIQPTRNRADLILHKATNHEIDEIYLKR